MDNSENLPVQRILRINIHLDSKFLFVPINYLKGGLVLFPDFVTQKMFIL